MTADTAYLCEAGKQGIVILSCRSLDSLAVVPEQVEGMPVTALAPYVFSAHEDHSAVPHPNAFWQSGAGRRISVQEALELSEVKGSRLEELRLPQSLRQVGAYGFYNCENLRRLELYSTTLDWGPGVFTGCSGIEAVKIHVDESRRSCLKEILAEIRQTVRVTYDGAGQARLIFPEYFEEAVENTPARILVTNTHGCGQMYRNAFVQTQIQLAEYDRLFPYVQVQEPERLVTELAIGRLKFPYCLSESHRERYMEYVRQHRTTAACQAVEGQGTEDLKWLLDQITYEREELRIVTEAANRKGNLSAVSLLMDRMGGKGEGRRRRFVL